VTIFVPFFSHSPICSEGLASILLSDLLSPDSLIATCSTRQFLLGGTVSLINLCCDSLTERLLKRGDGAFDVHYLKHYNAFDGERCLISSATAAKSLKCVAVQFTGSTEFFFVGSLMLRVSLYPCLRMKNEFRQRYRKILKTLEAASKDRTTPLPMHLKAHGKNAVSAMVGWNAFMQDETFVKAITKFALLQLQWLRTISKANNGSNLIIIPEWLCKEPSLWIAQAALTFSHLLKPHQAEAAVECATELLKVGTKMNHTDGAAFSPIVVHDLVKIIVAFVHAGVHKAKVKQAGKGRSRRALRPNNQDATDEDDRHLDIYHSFDHDDLGVAVFTNHLVLTNLCPTLLQTFCALDVIEGLDVDREHGFDKFQAKGEIADLLLWLIGHPNGLCMQSIAQLPAKPLVRFAKSVSAAFGFIFDDALHRLSDVAGAEKNKADSHLEDFINSQSKGAASRLHMSRIYLLLLCKLSKQPFIARCVAGSADESAALDLATMLVHFIDKLTCAAGGTNPDLDPCTELSSQILAQLPILAEEDVSNKCFDLLRARQKWDATYGFDISIFCHQLLALATCWDRSVDASSGIIEALSANEDLDVSRLRNIYQRLIQEDMAIEDTSEAILRHDGLIRRYGYHKFELLAPREENDDEAHDHGENMELKQQARQDQMDHQDISLVASYDDINAFLDKLERRVEERNSSSTTVTTTEVGKMEGAILFGDSVLTEEQYGSNLSFWLISSEPFRSIHDESSFAHYYDAIARSGGMTGSGKSMVKEARRCHTTLPVPHPNSAAFCCFGEERMDLCRSIITGPVDTPYSLGLFVFDVFFPATYPSIAPLVTFMTTGGGQTRFNPNLYQDGKVCLSLLGTWHASDESQKWNPQVSSLAQVLLSIQTQLLVTEPYFNEPGYDQTKGTFAGREGSKRYNSVLRLATLRHAIIGYLRDPPNGFAEVAKRHFSMSRKRIVVQAKRWMLEAKGTPLFARFEKAYADIVTLLNTESMHSFPALPPLADDVEALMTLDSNFVALCRGHVDDTPPSARQRVAHATVGNRVTVMPNGAQGTGTIAGVIASHVSGPDEAATAVPTSGANYNPWADPNSYADAMGQEMGETFDYDSDSDGSLYL
jgi:ubiquitin-protein ligase